MPDIQPRTSFRHTDRGIEPKRNQEYPTSRHLPAPLRKLELRATQVSDLSSLADCPLEVLHLPGSPIESIAPLRYLPLKEMNIIGLCIEDLDPLSTMPIERLSLSPDNLTDEQFEFLRRIEFESLIGPGDPRTDPVGLFSKIRQPSKRGINSKLVHLTNFQ